MLVVKDEFELMVSGIDALNTLIPFKVIVPRFAMTTPPVAAKGEIHSTPAVRSVEVLYCRVAAEPYVGAAETVAVPCMLRKPLTVGMVENVFTPVLLTVKLLKITAFPLMVSIPPFKMTVLEDPGVKVPELTRSPLMVNVLDPDI